MLGKTKFKIPVAASGIAAAILIAAFLFYAFAPQKVLVIAHRGASAYEPENTLSAFEKAVELGADAIEFDVQKSSDGVLVVMHDFSVDRTTNGTGSVSSLTLEQLKSLDAGDGQSVPTLQEALNILKGKEVHIEMKASNLEEDLARELRNASVNPRKVFVSSFFDASLKKFKEIAPEFQTAYLRIGVVPARDAEKFVSDVLATGSKIIASSFAVTNKNLTDAAHAKGLKVYVWTVNDEKTAREMLSLGVDGMYTEKPDLIKKIVTQR